MRGRGWGSGGLTHYTGQNQELEGAASDHFVARENGCLSRKAEGMFSKSLGFLPWRQWGRLGGHGEVILAEGGKEVKGGVRLRRRWVEKKL